MKGKVTNDETKERGHAILTITFDEEDVKPPDEYYYSVAVKGHPSGTYLQGPESEEKWIQGSEIYLPVAVQSWDGQQLVLELGPYFTDAFEDKFHFFFVKGTNFDFPTIRAETYKVAKPPRGMGKIDLPNPKAKFAVKQAEDITLMNRTEKEAELPPEPVPMPVYEPEPEPQPMEPPPFQEQTEFPAEYPTGLEPPPGQQYMPMEPPPGQQYMPMEQSPNPPAPNLYEGRKKSVLPIVLPVIFLLLAAAAAWYFIWHRGKAGDEPLVTEELQEEEKTPPTDKTPPAAKTPGKPLDEAKQLIRDGKSDEDLAAAVERLDGTPGAEEAVLLLVRKLAPTMPKYRMRYAEFLDPLSKKPSGTTVKSAKDAYNAYQLAYEGGMEEAAARQEALMDWAVDPENADKPGVDELLKVDNSGF